MSQCPESVYGARLVGSGAYFKHQFLRLLLTPFRNRRWLESFRMAAYYRGIINAERKRLGWQQLNCLVLPLLGAKVGSSAFRRFPQTA